MHVAQGFYTSSVIRYGLAAIFFAMMLPAASAQAETGAPDSAGSNVNLSPYSVWRSFQRLDTDKEQKIVNQVSKSAPLKEVAHQTPVVQLETVQNISTENVVRQAETKSTKDVVAVSDALPSRELVGEGDQLLISVFGQPDLAADVVVGETGIVTLPLVGAVPVRGKTPAEIAALFSSRLQSGQYVINPKVSVKVQQQISRSISVLGEVQKPGRYPMQGRVSILDALSLAGGLTARADKGVNVLHHAGKENEVVEYVPLKIDSETHSTPEKLGQELLAGDVIFVPLQKTFYVHGEVRKPGVYPLEEELTVMRVLSIGGGVTERGSLKRISIFRKSADGSLKEISVGITDPVLPGDVVYVNERIF